MKPEKIIVKEGHEHKIYEGCSRTEAQLMRMGEGYTLVRTRTTTKLIPHNEKLKGKYWIMKGLSGYELNFIKKVKNHFSTLPRPIRTRPYGTSTYYNRNSEKIKLGVYRDYCQIDITGAYWNEANRQGYLTDEIYQEGRDTTKIRKKVRLMALGSLAKRTEILKYEPPEYIVDIEIKECELEIFYDNITWGIGRVMGNAFRTFHHSILGYWVDAVFVRKEMAAAVKQYFKNAGFDVTIDPLEKIAVVPYGVGEVQIIRYFPSGEIKKLPPFTPGKDRISSLKASRERFREKVSKYLQSQE